MATTTTFVELHQFSGIAAPAISVAGSARAYFDSNVAQSIYKLSQNGGPFLPVLPQSGVNDLAADQTTNANTFADLISVTLAAKGNTRFYIIGTFAASVATTAGQGIFRLTLDTVAVRGAGITFAATAQPNSGSIVARTAVLSVGNHTVALQWRGSAINLGLQIRPVGAADTEHATLYVAELSG